ncbi:MAG: kinase/pyrophosphorylase, partial [Bacteroidetes bacterium]
YATLDSVKKELQYAHMLFNGHPEWNMVKVTAKPIEEIASNIIRIYRKKQKEVTPK